MRVFLHFSDAGLSLVKNVLISSEIMQSGFLNPALLPIWVNT